MSSATGAASSWGGRSVIQVRRPRPSLSAATCTDALLCVNPSRLSTTEYASLRSRSSRPSSTSRGTAPLKNVPTPPPPPLTAAPPAQRGAEPLVQRAEVAPRRPHLVDAGIDHGSPDDGSHNPSLSLPAPGGPRSSGPGLRQP